MCLQRHIKHHKTYRWKTSSQLNLYAETLFIWIFFFSRCCCFCRSFSFVFMSFYCFLCDLSVAWHSMFQYYERFSLCLWVSVVCVCIVNIGANKYEMQKRTNKNRHTHSKRKHGSQQQRRKKCVKINKVSTAAQSTRTENMV